MRLHHIVIVIALGASWGGVGWAQGLSPAEEAIQRRQIRGLEQRSLGGGVDPNELQRQRRGLIRDNAGPGFDGRGAVLDRQLEAVRQRPRVAPPGGASTGPDGTSLPSTVELAPEGLPGTMENPSVLLPGQGAARVIAPGGSTDVVTTASRLLARADRSLDAGDEGRARSDIEFAGRLLDGFPEVQPGHAAYPRLATARNRLKVLRERLPAD